MILPREVNNKMLIGDDCDLPIVFYDLLIDINRKWLIVDVCNLLIGFCDL